MDVTVMDERDDDVVVLVDRTNSVLGVAPKLDAHRDGRLHRAVSVVLFDREGRVLLQQRATGKYHSGGLWSNTCCGHPRPDETATAAAHRRLNHELGIENCALTPVSEFVYYADVDGGLVEHELDQVLIGCWTGQPKPDPHEVSATRWVEPEVLFADLAVRPRDYTAWTRQVVSHACSHRKALE
jgi:isopentenyl-diphosphate delta-isomerase